MEGYKKDDNGEIIVENGDFVRGDITDDIIISTANYLQGDDKSNPLFGCGLRLAMGGRPDDFFQPKLIAQTKAQGIIIKRIDVSKTEIIIEK